MNGSIVDDYKEIEIDCSSELTNISLGGSLEYSGSINNLDTTDLDDWLEESFWENFYEFEPFIEKAKNLVESDKTITYEDALKRFFGRFILSFSENEKPVTVHTDLDANARLYSIMLRL